MKSFVFFGCLIAVFLQTECGSTDDVNEALRKAEAECKTKHVAELGLKECAFRKVGLLNQDGSLNEDKFVELFHNNKENASVDRLRNLLHKCGSKGGKYNDERIEKLVTCIAFDRTN